MLRLDVIPYATKAGITLLLSNKGKTRVTVKSMVLQSGEIDKKIDFDLIPLGGFWCKNLKTVAINL